MLSSLLDAFESIDLSNEFMQVYTKQYPSRKKSEQSVGGKLDNYILFPKQGLKGTLKLALHLGLEFHLLQV